MSPPIRCQPNLQQSLALIVGPRFIAESGWIADALFTLSDVLFALLILFVLAIILGFLIAHRPHGGRLERGRPRGDRPDLTIGSAASATKGGMALVKAYLEKTHPGARVAAEAGNQELVNLYERLGLKVVKPGHGWMAATIPDRE